MKVLVTGSNGFLGTQVVRSLLAQTDCDIQCLVRPGSSRKNLERVISADIAGRATIVSGSLKSVSAACELIDDIDTVYHLAAGMSGSAADLILNSVVASKNLLEAIRTKSPGKRVVLISSFGVYGAAKLRRGALLDESAPLEPHPEKRDLYSFAKLRQEELFREYRDRYGISLVILRPGVIYGPNGPALSSRIGLSLGPVYLHLGGHNTLPLTFVANCADAIVCAGQSPASNGETFNVVDDDLPSCSNFLRAYCSQVRRLRVVSLPLPMLMVISRMVESYSRKSKGQIPPVFTPYKTLSTWKGSTFSNKKLKSLGWTPAVSTRDGMRQTFEALRASNERAV